MRFTGYLALILLGLGVAIIAGVALFDPHGGHGVAGWVWLAFLSLALGLLLGVLYLIIRAFRR